MGYAYAQIQKWMIDLEGEVSDEQQLVNNITELALKYKFVTKYTSMVVKEASDELPATPIPAKPSLIQRDAAPMRTHSYQRIGSIPSRYATHITQYNVPYHSQSLSRGPIAVPSRSRPP